MGIKVVQRGYTTLPVNTAIINVTISAVNLSKTFVIGTNEGVNNSTNSVSFCTFRLTSTTNLEIQRSVSSGEFETAWEVVEFE